jgi:hypothetical protein
MRGGAAVPETMASLVSSGPLTVTSESTVLTAAAAFDPSPAEAAAATATLDLSEVLERFAERDEVPRDGTVGS